MNPTDMMTLAAVTRDNAGTTAIMFIVVIALGLWIGSKLRR